MMELQDQGPATEVPISDARVPKSTLLIVFWAGVGMSMIFVIFRAYIRLRLFRRFTTDDYFLVIAWLASLINTIIWHVRSTELYFATDLVTGHVTQYPADIGTQMNHYLRAILATYIVQYTGLWCVKLSFLFFFRGLGEKIRSQMILWWCTCAFIIASFVVCLGTIDYNCLTSEFPQSIEACTKPSTTSFEYVTIRLTSSLDVLTDASIIALSTNILWRVRISVWRKIALTGICSVTALIIAVTVARVVAATSGPQLDLTTVLLWGGVELSVAVIAACLASFRSLYTASRNERLKEASRNENKTGSFQNMSDGINIPLRQSPSQETQKDRNEAPYWSTSASGNMDDLVQIRTHWS